MKKQAHILIIFKGTITLYGNRIHTIRKIAPRYFGCRPCTAAFSDDDIIRRRLLIDGEGGNDDKRLNNLLKTFIRWSTSKEDDDNTAAMYQRMQAMIGQCEYTLEKALNTYEMNKIEQENYEKLSKDIENRIEEATARIAEAKSELLLAKCIRKNRQEYDNLAKIIQQQPDRQATTKQLQALDKELSNLAATKQQLEEKLELRKKQFMVLITSIHELQRILEADEQKESENKEEETGGRDNSTAS